MCSAPTCQMRFTHANRHCPEHPYDTLKRCDDFVIQAVTEQNHEVIKWLEKYKMEKEDRTPTRKTPKRTKNLCDTSIIGSSEKNENFNSNHGENEFPVTPSNPYKSRKGLMVELDMNAGLEASPLAGTKMKPTPKVIQWQEPLSQEEDSADEYEVPSRSTFNPKKRWLREAWQDDLARPLEPIVNMQVTDLPKQIKQPESVISVPTSPSPLPPPPRPPLNRIRFNPNEMRPTVLMVASKDKATPLVDVNATQTHHNHAEASQPTPTNIDYVTHTQPQSFETFLPMVAGSTAAGTICNSGSASHSFTDLVPLEEPLQTGPPRNRKWLGAMALMQLATDEHSLLSSLTTHDDVTSDEVTTSTVQHSSYTEL